MQGLGPTRPQSPSTPASCFLIVSGNPIGVLIQGRPRGSARGRDSGGGSLSFSCPTPPDGSQGRSLRILTPRRVSQELWDLRTCPQGCTGENAPGSLQLPHTEKKNPRISRVLAKPQPRV